MAAGPETWRQVRVRVATWLAEDDGPDRVGRHLVPLDATTARLPFTVADYVDFYASRTHAETVGAIFRPGARRADPRTGCTCRSATTAGPARSWSAAPTSAARRASAATRTAGRPCSARRRKLDIECELGFVVGTPSDDPDRRRRLERHVFGVVLLNDWSARDIQAWEYVPARSVPGQVVRHVDVGLGAADGGALRRAGRPAAARAPAAALPGRRVPRVRLQCEVSINGTVVSRPPYRDMYYTPAQMLAHLSVNGATVRTGDLFASGTISGPERDQRGCLLELTWDGRDPLTLADGSTRTFLQDGDEVVITATAPRVDGGRVGLGEVRGRIVGA